MPSTTKTPEKADRSAPSCSLMPVNFEGKTIIVDVSPLTADEFKQWAIGELKAHIEWGKQVFPFITANKVLNE